MGVCLALTYLWRNDLRQPGPGPVTHDGSRFERHEPGDCGDDSDYCDWLHCGRSSVQDHRTASATEVGTNASHVELGSGPFLVPTPNRELALFAAKHKLYYRLTSNRERAVLSRCFRDNCTERATKRHKEKENEILCMVQRAIARSREQYDRADRVQAPGQSRQAQLRCQRT